MTEKVPVKVTEIRLTYKNKVKAANRPQITESTDAYRILKSNWSDQIALLEEFHILLLDRSNRVLAMCPISKGGITGTVVDIKIVFAAAIKGRASSIILAHNHPSGNLTPSRQDIDLTCQFMKAGKILDIKILDHLILSPDDKYCSFADSHYLPSI